MDVSIVSLDIVNVKSGLYVEAVVYPDELIEIKVIGLDYKIAGIIYNNRLKFEIIR